LAVREARHASEAPPSRSPDADASPEGTLEVKGSSVVVHYVESGATPLVTKMRVSAPRA